MVWLGVAVHVRNSCREACRVTCAACMQCCEVRFGVAVLLTYSGVIWARVGVAVLRWCCCAAYVRCCVNEIP